MCVLEKMWEVSVKGCSVCVMRGVGGGAGVRGSEGNKLKEYREVETLGCIGQGVACRKAYKDDGRALQRERENLNECLS